MSEAVWNLDNLTSIGGWHTTVLGSPKVIDTPWGKAVEFDGEKDALIVDTHPLTGLDRFTIEITFRPDAEGLKEQRFLHLQENDSENRILFETRLVSKDRWYLDTFIKSGDVSRAQLAETFTHPTGEWYHAALVFDGREMRHYVNGLKELSGEIAFIPAREGKTSIGVRMNRVSWFKGAIRKVRFTPRALAPEDFL